MFPVEFLVTNVADYPLTEDMVHDRFKDDLEKFGNVKFNGGCIMSCGPFGANLFYRFRIEPCDVLQLALLLEYAQEPREGMVSGVLRDNRQTIGAPSERLGTPLSLTSEGGYLDELPPPETSAISSLDHQDIWVIQSNIVSEWISAREYIDSLEAENAKLKAIINKG